MEKVEWRQRLKVTPNKKVIYLDSSFSIHQTATRMTARKTVTLSLCLLKHGLLCTDQFTIGEQKESNTKYILGSTLKYQN